MSLFLHDDRHRTALPTLSSAIFDGIPYVMVEEKLPRCGSLESLHVDWNTFHYEIRSQANTTTTLSDREQFVESASFHLPTLARMSSLHLPSCFLSPPAVNPYPDGQPSSPFYFSNLVQTTDSRVHPTNITPGGLPFEGSPFNSSSVSWSSQDVFRSLTPASCLYACYPCTPCQAPGERRQQSCVKFLNFSATFKNLKLTVRRTSVNPITLLKKHQSTLSRAKAAEHRRPRSPNALSTVLFNSLDTATLSTSHKPNNYERIDSWIDLSNTSLGTTAVPLLNKVQDFPETTSSAMCSASIFRRTEEREPSPGRSLLLSSPFRSRCEFRDSNCSYFLQDSDISSSHSARMFTPTRSFVCADADEGERQWSMPGGWPFNL